MFYYLFKNPINRYEFTVKYKKYAKSVFYVSMNIIKLYII